MQHNVEASSALPPLSPPSQPSLLTYRITRADDLTLIFDPPIRSQELADTLSYHYPLQEGLQQKLQQASLDFFRFGKGGVPESKANFDFFSLNSPIGVAQSPPPLFATPIGPSPLQFTTRDNQTLHSTASVENRPIRPRSGPGAFIDTTVWDIKAGQSIAKKTKGRTKGKGLEAIERERVAKNRGNACERHRRSRTKCLQEICLDNRLNACSYHRQNNIKCQRSCPNNLLNNKESTRDKEDLPQGEASVLPNQSSIHSVDSESVLQEPFQPPHQLQQYLQVQELHLFEHSQQHEQSETAQYSQYLNIQPEDIESLYNSLPLSSSPLEESKNLSPFNDFSFLFGDTDQYGGHRNDFVDNINDCNLGTGIQGPPGFEQRQFQVPATEAGAGWPHGYIDFSRAGVDIDRAALERLRVCCSGKGPETSRSAIEEYDVGVGRLIPSRRKGAPTAEINLECPGVESPTDRSRYGYDTPSSLGERASTSQTSHHYWSPERYRHCLHAVATIAIFWTPPGVFSTLFLESHRYVRVNAKYLKLFQTIKSI